MVGGVRAQMRSKVFDMQLDLYESARWGRGFVVTPGLSEGISQGHKKACLSGWDSRSPTTHASLSESHFWGVSSLS